MTPAPRTMTFMTAFVPMHQFFQFEFREASKFSCAFGTY
jgi:hypothetical protein